RPRIPTLRETRGLASEPNHHEARHRTSSSRNCPTSTRQEDEACPTSNTNTTPAATKPIPAILWATPLRSSRQAVSKVIGGCCPALNPSTLTRATEESSTPRGEP